MNDELFTTGWYFIQWEDAHGVSQDWEEIGCLDQPPLLVESVGWINEARDDYIIITPHITRPTDNKPMVGCGAMTIPINMIRLGPIKLEIPEWGGMGDE